MNGGSAAGIKSVSLKNLAQKVQQPVAAKTSDKEEVKEEAPIDPTWNESFDQEKLNEVWRKFTRQYDSQPRIHTIYKNHPPQLLQANTLLIKLRNNTQEHELNKERSTILSYLRRHLKNAGISLNLEISQEEDKTAQKAFTVADKYKAMAEKNPALAMFRKQFNLDLE
ncbi:hypothetical protein [Carboxylicivirga mesophila]|uniref:hypothetical protein n=1 Tax=Carboxylicivirga mesophila TaxID=1166478 RepID=UPI001FD01B22|nr:hypothetical protein [Carboxylicivirga mesophila]